MRSGSESTVVRMAVISPRWRARDSKLFAAGVDIHGVHNWTAERAAATENRYEKGA